MSEIIDHQIERKASRAQKLANFLCWGRMVAAPLIAEQAIAGPSSRTYLFAGAIAAIGATDKADGILSRYAAKLRGGETSEHGAWLDQLSDKVYIHGALGGIAAGAMLHGRPTFGAICMGSQAVIAARDVWVTRERKSASGDGKETKAQWLGKLKTVMQMATVSIAASPITNFGAGENINTGELLAGGAVVATAGLAVASGVALVNNLNSQEPRLKLVPNDEAA
jgi:phosphatidylglycerophosphate synthase